MKVKELIAELQLYDAELDVFMYTHGNQAFYEIVEMVFNRDDVFGSYLSIEGGEKE